MPKLTFWYEFASTYSYPAAIRIDQIARNTGVEVTWQPFLLGPIFKELDWSTSPFNLYPDKGAYMWRDLERICSEQQIAFQRPVPFPQNGLLAARLAIVGMAHGWGPAFSKAVFCAEFGEGKRIDDVDLLAELVANVGGNPESALKDALTDTNKQRLKDATNEAKTIGIFGAPSFVTGDGELFWGNDRLEQALQWAK